MVEWQTRYLEEVVLRSEGSNPSTDTKFVDRLMEGQRREAKMRVRSSLNDQVYCPAGGMADTPVSNAGLERGEGSSPSWGTKFDGRLKAKTLAGKAGDAGFETCPLIS